jgi:hypothetical protein
LSEDIDITPDVGEQISAADLKRLGFQKIEEVNRQTLMQLMMMIRRTDVELRHLTDNKSLKEFETDLLRIMTLIRVMMVSYMVISTLLDPLASSELIAMNVGMLGLAGVTSAGVMSELS